MRDPDVEILLLNWARWARSDKMKLGFPEPSIFKFWIPKGDSRDPGWGDEDAAVEARDLPVDIRRAEALDPYLLRLRVRHWHTIRRHYLQDRRTAWEDVYEAKRALADLLSLYPEVLEALA